MASSEYHYFLFCSAQLGYFSIVVNLLSHCLHNYFMPSGIVVVLPKGGQNHQTANWWQTQQQVTFHKWSKEKTWRIGCYRVFATYEDIKQG